MPEDQVIEISYKEKPSKGRVTRQFTMWCGICGDWQIESDTNVDHFIDRLTDSKTGKWRLSREHGFVHKSCCQMMPTKIKL